LTGTLLLIDKLVSSINTKNVVKNKENYEQTLHLQRSHPCPTVKCVIHYNISLGYGFTEWEVALKLA